MLPPRTRQPLIRSRNFIRKAGPNLSRVRKIVRKDSRSIGLSLRDSLSPKPAAPAPTRNCVQIHTARSRAAQPTVLRIP